MDEPTTYIYGSSDHDIDQLSIWIELTTNDKSYEK